MKVFVTVGTQKQQFTRLLRLVENSKELEKAQILAQVGHTKYQSDKIKIVEFMSQDKVDEEIEESDIIITHGGVGSIFTALKKSKKILAVPRLSKYDEHVDDHQIEICEELEKEGYILYLNESDIFDEKIKQLQNTEFKKYVTDTRYLDILRKEI